MVLIFRPSFCPSQRARSWLVQPAALNFTLSVDRSLQHFRWGRDTIGCACVAKRTHIGSSWIHQYTGLSVWLTRQKLPVGRNTALTMTLCDMAQITIHLPRVCALRLCAFSRATAPVRTRYGPGYGVLSASHMALSDSILSPIPMHRCLCTCLFSSLSSSLASSPFDERILHALGHTHGTCGVLQSAISCPRAL